eukprot:TRINITY_DN31256_c0_g4_i1.p2 TRINITY_DN31256_c0_g4~~TRINITY_DN31256_c0_g4_i1.p2  ORF type:complete len:176 (-),score=18.91 TRINITY_DN31256_c0_g4_i1:63-590(-)
MTAVNCIQTKFQRFQGFGLSGKNGMQINRGFKINGGFYGQVKRSVIRACENGNLQNGSESKREGPSTDFKVLRERIQQIGLPYWMSSEEKGSARVRLFGVLALTLGTTGVSVLFNFLGRDFFNALSEKNADLFTMQLFKYLGGFVIGIPVFVFRDFYQSKLVLEWREWMTQQFLG